jgi:hypothetical protein
MNGVYCIGKKESMGDTTMDLVLVAVIGVGGYLVYRAVSGLLTSNKDKAQQQNNQTVQNSTPGAVNTSLQQAQAKGQTATLNAATINSLATTIAHAVQSGPDDIAAANAANEAAIQVNNAVDWLSLLQAFGTRQDFNNNSVDMVTGLKEIWSQQTLSDFVSYLSDQGIIQPGSSI